MPYADPDKQREAKRRYEQEKRKQRRTNWMLVFYEDQCPEWRDEARRAGVRTLVSPSHDADEWTARDEKKNPKHQGGYVEGTRTGTCWRCTTTPYRTTRW